MRHGIGTAIDADGSIYHGNFMDNMRHGNGTLQVVSDTGDINTCLLIFF